MSARKPGDLSPKYEPMSNDVIENHVRRALRIKAGIGVKQMGRRMGIRYDTITAWEESRFKPGIGGRIWHAECRLIENRLAADGLDVEAFKAQVREEYLSSVADA